uniref:Receptor ligand binding region domain-containing protein n=1 Tax=Panagrolaimus sp. ES5 TaxID=591445 RepID=A0AC34G633_9BILA
MITAAPPQASPGTRIIKIGAMFPRGISSLDTKVSYSRTVGGLTVGLNKVFADGILPNTNFSFSFYFNQCNAAQASGGAISLIKDAKVDVIIGPACSSSVAMAATIGAYFNFSIFAWSTVLSADLSNPLSYPTLASTYDSTYSLVQALGRVFRTMVYKRETTDDSYYQIRTSLRRMKTQDRIIVSCYEVAAERRNFISAALDERMTTNDYVFVFLVFTQVGFGDVSKGQVPLWVDTKIKPDGKDNEIKKACEKALLIDIQQLPSILNDYYEKSRAAMFQWPINCQGSDCPVGNTN